MCFFSLIFRLAFPLLSFRRRRRFLPARSPGCNTKSMRACAVSDSREIVRRPCRGKRLCVLAFKRARRSNGIATRDASDLIEGGKGINHVFHRENVFFYSRRVRPRVFKRTGGRRHGVCASKWGGKAERTEWGGCRERGAGAKGKKKRCARASAFSLLEVGAGVCEIMSKVDAVHCLGIT